MRRNALPTILAFAPAILLPLAQDLLRPHLPHSGLLELLIGSSANLIIGFCFPFSILIRPSLFTERSARKAFHLWCTLTLTVLVVFEVRDPFGPSTFDVHDFVASLLGVGLALVVFHGAVRRRLIYAPA